MVRKCKFLLLITSVLIIRAAVAETLVLPNQLIEISAEAFAEDASIKEVVIPYGTLSIGDSAFSDCCNLGWISIPQTVKTLGDSFISGCADDILIKTVADSAACQYAQYNMIDYQADTVYRALLIGQTYPDIPALKLYGPVNDVAAFAHCVELFKDTPYEIMTIMNLTAEEMLRAIADTFGPATTEDVSLFYYSGHGVSSDESTQQGALLGADNEGSITADELRSALDKIPGRKIVIIDACYSGNMLAANSNLRTNSSGSHNAIDSNPGESFADSFITAFSKKKRSNLVGDNYFVLTSAADDEESFESTVGNVVMGLFTSYLVKGCGYDMVNSSSIDLLADSGDNGVLSLQEIYRYTSKSIVAEGQHVRVYPNDCRWFGLLRK